MDEQPKRSSPKQSENGEKGNCVFSPGFRSVAAMAGWDEEALLMASLVVEDTPDRDAKQKRRSDPLFKTPPTNSRRYETLIYAMTFIIYSSVLFKWF